MAVPVKNPDSGRRGWMVKILVVEDELYARESLVWQIEKYDTDHLFRILLASNGEEGEKLYRKHHPELVITDIRMPRMDGLQLLARIRQTDEKTKVIILSAYSDFEYARSALSNGASDYLLKPVDDTALENCLNKFLQRKRNEEKDALMTGTDIVTQFIRNCIRDEKYSNFVGENVFGRIFRSWQITVISFRNGRPERDEFLKEIERICGSTFWLQSRFLESENGLWILVTVFREDNVFLWRRLRNAMEQNGYTANLGISRVCTDAGSVGEAYREAVECLKYKIYQKDSTFLAEKLEKEKFHDYYLSKQKEEAMRSFLHEGNGKKAAAVLADIFDGVRELGIVRMECLELLYSRILLVFYQEMGTGGPEKELLKKTSAGILRFDSLEEMCEYLSQLAESASRMKNSDPTADNRKIVSFLMKYAREHYSEDVTIKEIAEKVLFMNQNYLSHLFVEKRGISFSAYLRQIRIGRAKELLEKGRYSVTEVATMVGYNDTSQFIRIFKQETGMTPKKYGSYLKGRKEYEE